MKHKLCGCLLGLCMAAAMAMPAFAGSFTPDMTMGELRSNPAITGTGFYTYGGDKFFKGKGLSNNKLLSEYVSAVELDDTIDALNLLEENYNSGVKVTWQVYTEQQIAQDASLGGAQLYYFPAETENAKFALVVPGNGFTITSELGEGASTAAQLHERGYAVFVLRYRTFLAASDNAPLQDVGNALRLIEDNADALKIQKEGYAIFGFSSGGQLAGLMASDQDYGYKHYGVPKPGAVLLSYPVNNFAEVKLLYHLIMDPGQYNWRYYWENVSDVIDENYTPTFFWYGQNDHVLAMLDWELQGEMLKKTLEKYNVPHEVIVYGNAKHGVGTGHGTDADGWVDKAVAFWEEQTK